MALFHNIENPKSGGIDWRDEGWGQRDTVQTCQHSGQRLSSSATRSLCKINSITRKERQSLGGNVQLSEVAAET